MRVSMAPAPGFALLVVTGSPEQDAVRERVQAQAGELGVKVPASFRFPLIEVKSAKQYASLKKLLSAARYETQVLPWKGFLEHVAAWVKESQQLRRKLKGQGLLELGPSEVARLKKRVASTRRSPLARQTLLGGVWSPLLASALQFPAIQRLRPDDHGLISALRLGRELQKPAAARLKRFEIEFSHERLDVDDARRLLCGVPLPEIERCAIRCLTALKPEGPLMLAATHCDWAGWCEHLPRTLGERLRRTLTAQFMASFAEQAGRPYKMSRKDAAWYREDDLSPAFSGSWLDAWTEALWGRDDEGGRVLKRNVAAALKKAGHPREAKLVAKASPY
jgi:hypothetical protein